MSTSRTAGNEGIHAARVTSGLTTRARLPPPCWTLSKTHLVISSAPGSLAFVPAKIDHPALAANLFSNFFKGVPPGCGQGSQLA
jgi:hypothetical protein